MLERESKPGTSSSQNRGSSLNPQSRKLLLALVLLLVALAVVILKDHQFWFGSTEALNDEEATPVASTKPAARVAAAEARPAATVNGTVAASSKKHTIAPIYPVGTPTAVQASAAAQAPGAAQASDEPAVTATRTVLPPLDVEVVAGDKHSTIRPGSNATKVEITRPGSEPLAAATKAAERERLTADMPQASYPLLAQHMNVQGSVILQALIGADGVIQHIKVVNGPAILTSAAEQAVREWRFKPVLQNGQAVETQARITVNFNIKVADGSGKTTVAENEPARIQILSR